MSFYWFSSKVDGFGRTHRTHADEAPEARRWDRREGINSDIDSSFKPCKWCIHKWWFPQIRKMRGFNLSLRINLFKIQGILWIGLRIKTSSVNTLKLKFLKINNDDKNPNGIHQSYFTKCFMIYTNCFFPSNRCGSVVQNPDGLSFWEKRNLHQASGLELFLMSPWVKMMDQSEAFLTSR